MKEPEFRLFKEMIVSRIKHIHDSLDEIERTLKALEQRVKETEEKEKEEEA